MNWNKLFPHWNHVIRFSKALENSISAESHSDSEIQFALEVEKFPKTELHVHIEAALSHSFYNELNNSIKLFSENEILPSDRTPFENFGDFITAWIDNTKLIQSETIFHTMGIEFVKNRFLQNIVYTEAHCSPADFSILRVRSSQHGQPLDYSKCLLALLSGIKVGQTLYPNIDVRLIVDALWFSTAQEKDITANSLEIIINKSENNSPMGGKYIVAVGLGGPNESKNSALILPFITRCRIMGLKVDIHCGEVATIEYMQDAIETLNPDRIGHGIAGAPHDFFFKGHTAACPLSNLLTGSHKGTIKTHAIQKMMEKGVNFSVNSDDPLLFATTLTLEYVALQRNFSWTMSDVIESQTRAKSAAFYKSQI